MPVPVGIAPNVADWMLEMEGRVAALEEALTANSFKEAKAKVADAKNGDDDAAKAEPGKDEAAAKPEAKTEPPKAKDEPKSSGKRW